MDDKGTLQLDLKDELPELLELDALRRRAIDLRDKGLKAMMRYEGTDEVWDTTDDHPASVLLRNRVLAKVNGLAMKEGRDKTVIWPTHVTEDVKVDKGKITQTKIGSDTPGYPRLHLKKTESGKPLTENVHEIKAWKKDKLAVFTAAYNMRARLDHRDAFQSNEFLQCYYVVLRELYTIGEPDWTFGAARASLGRASTSTFVTMECARALGHFEFRLKETAAFLRILQRHQTYVDGVNRSRMSQAGVEKPLYLLDSWCDAEVERVGMGLLSLCSEYEGRTLLDLSKWKEGLRRIDRSSAKDAAMQVNYFLESNRQNVRTSLADASANITACLEWVETLETAEAATTDDEKDDPSNALTVTANRLFEGRLKHTNEFIATRLQRHAENIGLDMYSDAADVFERSGARLRELLGPVHRFMTFKLNKILLRAQEEGELSHAQELAFAASSASLFEMDDRPVFKKAKELLEAALDQDGLLPPGPAFYEHDDDTVRIPSNAHAIGALSQLMKGPVYGPRLETVRRMVNYFERGLVETRGLLIAQSPDKLSEKEDDRLHVWGKRHADGQGYKGTKWLTCVNLLALDRVVRMLNTQINSGVLKHFNVKQAIDLGGRTKMDDLMCSDMGLVCLNWEAQGRRRRMLTYDMERMRRWLVPKDTGDRDPLASMILYGPPGTGKTTIVGGLAACAGVPMVEVTPSDLIIRGTDAVEYQTTVVMKALSLLTRVVILFDEFDPVIADRGSQKQVTSIFSFLTGAMLPKLAELNKAAKKNHFVYVLATNFIERLDDAAIRPGRFDHKRGVYPPDLASRICRIVSELNKWQTSESTFRDGWHKRLIEVICQTANAPMERLVMKGWFNPPNEGPPEPKKLGIKEHDQHQWWADQLEDKLVGGMPLNAFDYIAWGGTKPPWYPMPTDLRPTDAEDIGDEATPDGRAMTNESGVEAPVNAATYAIEDFQIKALATRNNLVIDQAIELALVGYQNWLAWDLRESLIGEDWMKLLEVAGHNATEEERTTALLETWKAVDAATRRRRIEYARELQVPLGRTY